MVRTITKLVLSVSIPLLLCAMIPQRALFHQNNFTSAAGGCAYSDASATAYINLVVAAGVTGTLVDTTHRCALHQFVTDEKATGFWTGDVAIYFCPWQNAAANAINMRNPGTYDLTFAGSPTMSSAGVVWNGTSQYASTGMKQNALSQDDAHFSYYSQTNNGANLGYEIGVIDGVNVCALRVRSSTATGGHASISINTTAANSLGALGSLSLITNSKTASNAAAVYRAGSSFGTYIPNASTAPGTTYDYYLGANNNNGTAANFSVRTMSYADFGPSYTSGQEALHYAHVQALHTAFSIQQ